MRNLSAPWRSGLILLLAVPVGTAGCGKSLEGQIQDQVRTLDQADLDPDDVEVTSINARGDEAVAEITVKTAVKMRKVNGKWVIDEVRLAGGKWEKADRIVRALNQEREQQTRDELARVKAGIERYRAREGRVPEARTFAQLIDTLNPRDLRDVIRIDPWWNIYFYRAFSADSYEIRSTGPDGYVYTADDLVLEG